MAETRTHLPILRAIILDFSAVNNVDVSAVQNLVDVRKQLDRYAAPAIVSWHFANITNRWTKRALASAGFGYPKLNSVESSWKPVIVVADFDDASEVQNTEKSSNDVEQQGDVITSTTSPVTTSSYEKAGASVNVRGKNAVALYGVNRPFFHVDVAAAVESALSIVEQTESKLSG